MNTLTSCFIENPFGKTEECAMFTIDDIMSSFILHDVMVVDRQYTMSFWVKADMDCNLLLCGESVSVSSEWSRHVITFVAKGIDLNVFFDTSGTYYMYHPQLETGSIPTDYVRAPEDVQDDIDKSVEQMSSRLEITRESIIQTVSETYATIDSVETVKTMATQTSTMFSWLVEGSADDVTSLTLTSTMAELITGSLVIKDASGKSTIISGGTIDLETLFAQNITATNLHITGDSTFDGVLNGATGSFTGTISATEGEFGCLEVGDGYVIVNSKSAAYPKASAGISAWCINLDDANLNKQATYEAHTVTLGPINPANGTLNVYLSSYHNAIIYAGKYNSSSGGYDGVFEVLTNGSLHTIGSVSADGSIVSNGLTHGGQFKAIYGNYGVMLRNDGSGFYILLTDAGNPTGSFNTLRPFNIGLATGQVSINGSLFKTDSTYLKCNSYFLGFYISSNDNYVFRPFSSDIANAGTADAMVYLGSSGSRWITVYAKNGTSTSSDERDKNIFNIDKRYKDLLMSIRTISYTWKDDDDGKIHVGVSAQQTEKALISCGFDPGTFGALDHDFWDKPNADGRMDRYSVNYDEIAMLMLPVVQDHETRLYNIEMDNESHRTVIDELIDENTKLKKRVEQLENKLTA